MLTYSLPNLIFEISDDTKFIQLAAAAWILIRSSEIVKVGTQSVKTIIGITTVSLREDICYQQEGQDPVSA